MWIKLGRRLFFTDGAAAAAGRRFCEEMEPQGVAYSGTAWYLSH